MFIFIQSIIVYGIMIWAMVYFGNIAYKKQYPQGYSGIDTFSKKKLPVAALFTNSYFLIPILVFCTFAALRYKVGVDCETYKLRYYEITSYLGFISRDIEPAFIFLGKLTGVFCKSHYLFFFVLALLQIAPLYYAQRKTTYTLKYFGLVLMCLTFSSLMNGVRQNIAACLFVALLPLILEKKNWIWFIIGIYLASLMHKSAYTLYLIGVIAYFFQYKILNKYIQLAILVACVIFSDKIDTGFITDRFSTLGADAGYDESAIDAYSNQEATAKSFGLVMYLRVIIYAILIWFSKNMKELFNSKTFNIQYNLYLIAIYTSILFYNNFVINRLILYIEIFIPIIIAACMFYLCNSASKKNRIYLKALTFLLFTYLLYEQYKSMVAFPMEFSLYKFDFFQNNILTLY